MIDTVVHQRLDVASNGLLRELTEACRTMRLHPFIMVQTEGLAKGEMRIIAVGIDNDGRTRFFDAARVPKKYQKDGLALKAFLAKKRSTPLL